jgi:hypothetical protein
MALLGWCKTRYLDDNVLVVGTFFLDLSLSCPYKALVLTRFSQTPGATKKAEPVKALPVLFFAYANRLR